jgi:hypothetical protein
MLVLQWNGIYTKFHEDQSTSVYNIDGQVDTHSLLTDKNIRNTSITNHSMINVPYQLLSPMELGFNTF